MKKLYKQLMKISALICLFLLVGGNAWGEKSWSDYYGLTLSNGLSNTEWRYVIGNSSAGIRLKAKTSVTYSQPSSSSTKGVLFTNGNILYLMPMGSNCKAVLLKFSKPANSSAISINISCSATGMNENYEISRDPSTSSNSGQVVVFEVTPGEEYTISSSGNFYLNNVTYVDANDIIELDETVSGNISKIQTKKNYVKLNRTLSSEYWNTFCLPINIVKLSMQNQMRCSASYQLDNYDNSENTIGFTQLTSLEANTPCLVKPSKTLTNPIFASASAGQATQKNKNSITNYNNPSYTSASTYNEETLTATESNGDLSFVGVYEPTNLLNFENAFYLNTSSNLVYPTNSSNSTIKGLRAYFQLASGINVKDLNFVFDDSESTGIKTVERNIFNEGRVYSIDGRYMGDSTDNLSRGIYIQNGRKFVVK